MLEHISLTIATALVAATLSLAGAAPANAVT